MLPLIVSLFNSKYRNYIIAIIALLTMGLWAAYWVSGERAEAVAEYKQAVTEATNKQVKEDEIKVIDAYKPNSAIESHVDSMLAAEPAKAIGSDKLRRSEESTATAGRSEASVSMGAPDVLSDTELDAIRKHANLLQ